VTYDLSDCFITIARVYKWTPKEIEQLFIDGYDHNSLEFWVDDAQKYVKEIKESGKL